ncbi:MAG: hypothetical protein AAF847_05815 [Bacteroidota bacterium]
MSEKRESRLSQWLDQLQEQSWNLELIISGFVLFGLFQLRGFLSLYAAYAAANDTALPYVLYSSLYIFRVSLDIFIFALLALVFTRGLWIGALGLRYVSGEIDFEHFKYSPTFKEFLKKKVGSFDDYIHKLENLSSTIFAFTYLLFFIALSILLFDIELKLWSHFLYGVLPDAVADIMMTISTLTALVVAFDFLMLGLLKSIKLPIFSKVYLVLYRIAGILTLSFLWRPLWYNFIDQKSTKWVAALSFPLLLGFMILDYVPFKNFGYSFFPKLNYKTEYGRFSSVYYKENARAAFQDRFYDDRRAAEKAKGNYYPIDVMSIPSHRIETPMMEVFVKYTSFIEDLIVSSDSTIMAINKIGINSLDRFNMMDIDIVKKTKSEYDEAYEERQLVYQQKYDSLWRVDAAAAETLQLAFDDREQLRYRNYLDHIKSLIKQSVAFSINHQIIPDSAIDLSFYVHPNLNEEGFVCTFPLTNAKLGTNYLTLKQQFLYDTKAGSYERDFTIPFIYIGQVMPY